MTQQRTIDSRTASTIEQHPVDVPECRHHWVIASPNGPTSEGMCRLCGANRYFRNSTDDYIGDGTVEEAGSRK